MSSPQHRGVAGFKNGHADLRLAFPVADVIGAGAKGVGDGGSTWAAFGHGRFTCASVLVQFCLRMHVKSYALAIKMMQHNAVNEIILAFIE